jgi:hypothetical protein
LSSGDAEVVGDGGAAGDAGEIQSSNNDGTGGSGDYRSVVTSDHPVAYWRLGESTGPIAADETGAHPGTMKGALTLGVPGALPHESNTATNFLGSDGEIEIGDAFGFVNAPFSIEGWLKPTALDVKFLRVVTKKAGDDAGLTQGYSLYVQQGAGVGFEILRDDVRRGVSATIPIGEFSHVVVTYDMTTIRLYVNGMQADQNLSSAVTSSPASLVLGALSSGGFHYNGVLDEVALYDHALSADRITAHVAAAGR